MVIPFYKQETDWTCGPAAMRMALDALGIKRTEKQLLRALRTDNTFGTRQQRFEELARNLQLEYTVKKEASLSELRKAVNDHVVIVNYFAQPLQSGHYSIVRSIGRKYIYMHDPTLGPNYRFALHEFEESWHPEGKEEDKRWFFGVKKK